jgi:NADH:ubiquinone oxidoreductase subunit 5 (subunit L)/multisubunit Na+/H+ antiporter MnhA subunit
MDALAAPLLHVQRSDVLWLIPLAPLGGAWVRRIMARKGVLPAMAPALVGLLIALSQLVGLAGLEVDYRQLVAPGPSPLRVGTMELGIGLMFDPLAAVMVVTIGVLAIAAQAYRAWGDATDDHFAIDVAAAGALLAVLADGFFGLLIGAAIASIGVAHAAERSAVVERAGDAALVLAAALLFWSLGGSWGISIGNEPTYTRRNPVAVAPLDPLDADNEGAGPSFVPVLIGAPPAAASGKPGLPDLNARGTITIADPPGAKVFLKGGMQPTGTTPLFQHQVYAGRMDIEIETDGHSPRRQRFRAVDVPAGREVTLVSLGPTLQFRALREQLTLSDVSRKRFARDLLDPSTPGHRRLGKFDAVTLIALLIGVAAIAPIAGAAWAGSALLIEAVVPLVAVYLLARLGFFFVLSANAATTIAIALALVAALAAARAAIDHRAQNLVGRLLAAQLAIAAAGAVLGAPSLGVAHAVASVLSCGVAWLLLDAVGVRGLRRVSGLSETAPRTARAAQLAALAIAGAPIPLLGAAFTRETLLARAFASELPYSKIVWVLLVCAAVAMAVAVWRAWFVVFAGPKGELEDPDSRVSLGLMLAAAAAVFLPPVLALSKGSVIALGGERSLAETFLDPFVDPAAILGADRAARFRELGRGADLGALGLVIVACAAAWFLVRRRLRDDDRPAVVVREWTPQKLPVSVFARLDDLIFARPIAALAGLFAKKRQP